MIKQHNYYQLKAAIRCGLFLDCDGELDSNFASVVATGSVSKHFIGIREIKSQFA